MSQQSVHTDTQTHYTFFLHSHRVHDVHIYICRDRFIIYILKGGKCASYAVSVDLAKPVEGCNFYLMVGEDLGNEVPGRGSNGIYETKKYLGLSSFEMTIIGQNRGVKWATDSNNKQKLSQFKL